MKRVVFIGPLCCLLLLTCGAWCQSHGLPADTPQGLMYDAPNPQQAQERKHSAQNVLPDAPSVIAPITQAEKFQAFVEDASSPLTFGAAGFNALLMRDTEEHLAYGAPSFADLYRVAVVQKESNAFFGKFLYPSLLKQDPRYHPSTSESVVGRTVYAVSRLLITRNDAGQKTLNTSYILGVLTSAAVATAYRPYWAQSAASTFGNFGSTIGSDAGMNVFHEFWPGIRRKFDGHSPKFVQRIEKMEEHLAKDPAPDGIPETAAH